MSNKLFTDQEIKILSKNKYVKNVSMKGITYTDEFKNIFIVENEKGKFPREIFEECGLTDTRKLNSGRPSEKELSAEEKYERLKAQNNLLKAENELLKKIQYLERELIKKK